MCSLACRDCLYKEGLVEGERAVSNKKEEKAPVEGIVDGTDFVELKRDMQSAKIVAWLQYNQQQLIAGVVTFVLILVGISLWKEREQSQKEAAALMYIEAVNKSNAEERYALLDSVVKTYPDSGYATLANLQKEAQPNTDEKKAALQALIDAHGAPEFVWQAKLDLAEVYLAEQDVAQAEALLDKRFGKHYEQARFALLVRTANNNAEKIELLEKALAAESHNKDLKAALESELAKLQASE